MPVNAQCSVIVVRVQIVGFRCGLPEFFPSSGMLRSVGWLSSDVSGQPVGPILTLEDGTDRLSRNVGSKPTYAT